MVLVPYAAPNEPLSVEIQGVGANVLYVMRMVPLDNGATGGRPILKINNIIGLH